MADPDDLARVWRLLRPDRLGTPLEVRVLLQNGGPPAIGRFRTYGAFGRAVAVADARADAVAGIYVLLNPLRPDAPWDGPWDRLRRGGRAARDRDVLARRWLLVDCDPARPAGTNATAAERAAALGRARAIRDALAAEGWPAPVEAASGNGAHLLYPVALPNDGPAAALVGRALRALGARFGDAAVAVDPAVGNAARITKCYGTLPRKGAPTPDRPWAPARLLAVPEPLRPVPAAALAALARRAPGQGGRGDGIPRGRLPAGVAAADLPAWLAAHGIALAGDPEPRDGGWLIPVRCPWSASHTSWGGAKDAAVLAGPDGVGFRCLHAHCAGRHWGDLLRYALRDAPGQGARPSRGG